MKSLTRRNFLKGTGMTLLALSGLHLPFSKSEATAANSLAPFSSGTDRPRFKVPANATDCHHHIYDSRFPVDPNSTLRHPNATVADYRLLQKRLGTTRNVIVQPSTYGVNNSGLVQSLREFGLATTRGIAVVNNSVTDEELRKLNAAGVRGIRFNMSVPGGATNMDMVLPLADRIYAMGWHIQVVAKADQIANGADTWNRLPCPIVFDHLGHVPNPSHPALKVIVNLMKEGKAWVKLSGAYIMSKSGAPNYEDRADVARAFVQADPNYLLWGSDWPHVTSKIDNKPDDTILLNLLYDWVPDEKQRNRILVDNPARLYGF